MTTVLGEHDGFPVYETEQVVALDWDRTTGDVDAARRRMNILAPAYGLDPEAIDAEYDRRKKVGESFYLLEFVEQQLGDEQTYRSLVGDFLSLEEPELMYPDAQRFIALLQAQRVPHLGVTHGSVAWQAIKMTAGGYPGYVDVMDNPYKGRHIARWRQGEGLYAFYDSRAHCAAICITQSICLIDDKPEAFQDASPELTGFCMRREDETDLTREQERCLEDQGVRVIHSYDELTIAAGRVVAGPRNALVSPPEGAHAPHYMLMEPYVWSNDVPAKSLASLYRP